MSGEKIRYFIKEKCVLLYIGVCMNMFNLTRCMEGGPVIVLQIHMRCLLVHSFDALKIDQIY